MPRHFPLLLSTLLVGCVPFPQLNDAISPEARRASYPVLQPVDELLARAAYPADQDSAAAIAALQARADLLKARARILRQTDVIDSASQDAMKAAFARLNP